MEVQGGPLAGRSAEAEDWSDFDRNVRPSHYDFFLSSKLTCPQLVCQLLVSESKVTEVS